MDALVKIAFGMVTFCTKFVFVDRMCFVFYADECPATIDLSITNAIVAFSLLCIFGSCRFAQLLFRHQSHIPRLLEFIIDGMMTTYLTDLIIRQLWIPLLHGAYRVCTNTSSYLMDMGRGDLLASVKPIAIWMRRDAMEVLRFGFALLFVYTMLHVTGVIAAFSRKYFEWFGRVPGDNMNWEESPTFLLAGADNTAARKVQSKSDLEVLTNRKLTRRRSPRRVSFKL